MRTSLVLVVLLAVAGPVAAQQLPTPPAADSTPIAARPAAGEELVDRVVAVVGDTVLLLSEVQAELQQMAAAGQPVPEDPREREQFARQLIQQRVGDLVLIEAARAANVEVQEREVTESVEKDLATVRQRFGSDAELRSALAGSGLTLEQYRATLAAQYRSRALRDRYLQQRLADETRPVISDEQIRQVFEQRQESFGSRPANISFSQVVIEPEPSDSAKAAARAEAETALGELRAGGDFEVLARRYSDDPGSREQGGSLGWFHPDRMVPGFRNVVYALRPGQTSGIVETEFGYHIIRLEKTRGAERQASHILIRPEITDADRARAGERADSVAAAIRSGTPVAEILKVFPADPNEQSTAERVPVDQLGSLAPEYATSLADAAQGAVVGPFAVEGPTGPSWVVVQVNDRQEAGAYSLDDVREQIRSRLQEQAMIQALVERLQRGMHVAVLL